MSWLRFINDFIVGEVLPAIHNSRVHVYHRPAMDAFARCHPFIKFEAASFENAGENFINLPLLYNFVVLVSTASPADKQRLGGRFINPRSYHRHL
jgi:hypothetical protein